MTEYRQQYRVWLDDPEAAFITFDICWPVELNLYEMVVAKHLRRKGVGSAVIAFAADLARSLKKKRLSVRPGQIGEQTKDELTAFYKRRGFAPNRDDNDLLELELDVDQVLRHKAFLLVLETQRFPFGSRP